jgi:WD40 repeat protein
MPDFDTRKPQEPNEPNMLGITTLADKLRSLWTANKVGIPLIANKVRTLLIASKGSLLLLAGRLRSLLVTNRLRTMLISGGILLYIVVAVPLALLYFFRWPSDLQQEPLGEAPNGKIAFVSDRDGTYGIYVMNADGTGRTLVASGGPPSLGGALGVGGPTWSPDGKIAFTRDRVVYIETSDATGNSDIRLVTSDIYVMNPDGSGETRLTNTPESETGVAWSPDGEELLLLADDPAGNPYNSETLFTLLLLFSGLLLLAGLFFGLELLEGVLLSYRSPFLLSFIASLAPRQQSPPMVLQRFPALPHRRRVSLRLEPLASLLEISHILQRRLERGGEYLLGIEAYPLLAQASKRLPSGQSAGGEATLQVRQALGIRASGLPRLASSLSRSSSIWGSAFSSRRSMRPPLYNPIRFIPLNLQP